ncbi:MAG: hypothetical protein ACOY0T_34260 [Myxococcota bacterium]
MPATSFSPRCSSCGQRAPIVFRGLETRCAACDAVRLPLAPSVSLAGQPARVGGVAARVLGWAALIIGLSSALALLLLLQSIWPGSFVGYAFALPLGVASLFFGVLLILGGRSLQKRGSAKQLRVRREAIRALISHRGGSVTSSEAANALGIDEAEADALLTDMSRESATSVRLDVDDDGSFRYDFRGDDARYRVLEEQEQAAASAASEPESTNARRSRA